MEELARDRALAYNATNTIIHNNNNNTNTNTNNNNNINSRSINSNSNNIKNNKAMQLCCSSKGQKLHQLPAQAVVVPCIKLDPDGGQSLEPEHWQQEHTHMEPLNANRLLLLQGSDDPLISHGASNDGHDEDQDYPFKSLLARRTEEQQTMQHGACSTLTKQQLKANLMNARKVQRQPVQELAIPTPQRSRQSKSKKRSGNTGAIKLRFHHQALPAEYAAHYEATQRRHLSSARTVPAVPVPKAVHPPQNQSHENVRSWLRKIAEIQRSAERQQQAKESSREPRTESATPAKPSQQPQQQQQQQPQPQQRPASVEAGSKRGAIKYADLPYMGEITLDNYKPRRGRKPKKADICHLIYKNYGTIVPAATTAAEQPYPVAEPKHPIAAPYAACGSGSLLSQRIVSSGISPLAVEEPLNLCLRDQSSDRYSISSSDSDKPSTVTNATTSTTECGSSSHRATPLAEDLISIKPVAIKFAGEDSRVAGKLLLQPVGLYYQQLMETCRLGVPVETIEKDNQLALKIPIPNGFFDTATQPDKRDPLEVAIDTATPPALRKRKRSAIFIPPMPAEHSSSISTEVSICKFKFTGGAKPTLEEKKMLSVDAEGNYRYYNGTGDRTLRGYEFISREQQQQQQQLQLQLQQQQQQQQATILSNANNDKLYIDIPPPSTDLSLELLHIPPESPTSSLLLPSSLVPVASQSPSSYSNSHSPMRLATPHPEELAQPDGPQSQSQSQSQPHGSTASPRHNVVTSASGKRRSSRRSKQREKLEKTFKEKGFLIQTQQLQSAEGATYCKFRQLKKFTRYLFRNWKDHIPDSDLCKHHAKDDLNREQHSTVLENILAGQIGLGVVDSLANTQATANPAT